MQQIDLDTAIAKSWDVVVVGTSFAAQFFVSALPKELNVLLVEKGPFLTHQDLLDQGGFAPDELLMDNRSGRRKEFVARSLYGGNSNCWAGQTPRFMPTDFTLFEDTGRGADWPLRYADLEPFYTEVEAHMEMAGDRERSPWPMSQPYPFPAHALARNDTRCVVERPDIWTPQPTARSNGGRRATCCDSEVCALCPVDAKFTILNDEGRLLGPKASILVNHEVDRVLHQNGRAGGVILKSGDGSAQQINAGIVALAANAIQNPAILMRSGITMPALGRYLHEQVGRYIDLYTDQPGYFGGSLNTSTCHAFWSEGYDRRERGAVMITNNNRRVPPRADIGRWTEVMGLKLVADDEPIEENRVELDEDGRARIIWVGHSDYAVKGLDYAESELQSILPFKIERVVRTLDLATEFHIQGTHRMGTDADNAVTDANCRIFGFENLFALGAGSFATCSPANPTLTLSAISLKAGRSL